MKSQPAIVQRPQARRDLIQHYAYIGEHNLGAAERFLTVIEENLSRLAIMPRMGRLWNSKNRRLHGVRVWPVPEFRKYIVFYRPIEPGIELLRVFHAARDIEATLTDDADA